MLALLQKLYLFHESSQGLAQLAPGDVECLGQDASLTGDSHEIGITNPSRECV